MSPQNIAGSLKKFVECGRWRSGLAYNRTADQHRPTGNGQEVKATGPKIPLMVTTSHHDLLTWSGVTFSTALPSSTAFKTVKTSVLSI